MKILYIANSILNQKLMKELIFGHWKAVIGFPTRDMVVRIVNQGQVVHSVLSGRLRNPAFPWDLRQP